MENMLRVGFTKGVMTSYDPSAIPKDAIWKSINLRSNDSGILRIRNGVEAVGSSLGTGSVQGLSNAFESFLTVWNQQVHLIDEQGTSTELTSLTPVGNSATDKVDIVNWSRSGAEIAYLFAGNGIFETDGSTTELVTPYAPVSGETTNLLRDSTDGSQDTSSALAKSKYAVLKASLSQRVVVAGSPDSPNTIWFSAPLDATYFPSDQIIQLPDDGAKITGLANWYNALIIFRDRDIWSFFGSHALDSSAKLVLQDSSVGCIAQRSIQSVTGTGIVFLGRDNVYTIRGVSGVENQARAMPIGENIVDQVQKAMEKGIENVSSVFYDNVYRLSIPNEREREVVFKYDVMHGESWYVDDGPRVNDFVIYNDDLYSTKLGEAKLLKYTDTLFDEDDPIEVSIAFRREDVRPLARVKRLFIDALSKGRTGEENLPFFAPVFNEQTYNDDYSSLVYISTGTEQDLDVTVVVDGEEFYVAEKDITVTKTNFLDIQSVEPAKTYEARFRPSLKANFLQLRIKTKEPGQDIALLGYGFEYQSSGRMKAKRSR